MRNRFNLNESEKNRIRILHLIEERGTPPTFSAGKWDAIFRLFDSDKSMKDALISTIQDGVNKSLPYSPGEEEKTWELTMAPDPTVTFDPTITSVTLQDIERWDGNQKEWNVATGTFKGSVDLEVEVWGYDAAGMTASVYGEVEIFFKIEEGKLYYEIKSLNASSGYSIKSPFSKISFANNKIKLWLNLLLWSGYVGSWDTGIEKELQNELDGEYFDATDWLIKNGYYKPKV